MNQLAMYAALDDLLCCVALCCVLSISLVWKDQLSLSSFSSFSCFSSSPLHLLILLSVFLKKKSNLI